MFLREDLALKEEYRNLTAVIFKSASERVNFTKTEDAVEKINAYCADQTDFWIKNLVEKCM